MIPSTPEQPGQSDAARIPAGTYPVAPYHTQIGWTVNHLGISLLQGTFSLPGGSITIDPDRPADTKVDISLDVANMAVLPVAFADHLRSADIFDVANNPTARFVSTAVEPHEGQTATIHGDLTLKGQTKPITIEARFVGAGVHPMMKKLNFGFVGTATIARSEFGVGFSVPYVSDTVDLHINAVFMAE